MSLAIFDLDNTLIAGDSDYLWGEFVAERGLVPKKAFTEANKRFYQDYCRGELNIHTYLSFVAGPLVGRTLAELQQLHQDFMLSKILPIELPRARELLEKHRSQGDFLLIITATNLFVTEAIAQWLEVDHILASELELSEGAYTGRPSGVPCYQEGKVTRLMSWLENSGLSLEGSYFYSDSHNDIPLLEHVDYPVAVDPDAKLKAVAKSREWKVISLRD